MYLGPEPIFVIHFRPESRCCVSNELGLESFLGALCAEGSDFKVREQGMKQMSNAGYL